MSRARAGASSSAFVLVDDAAEEIFAADRPTMAGPCARRGHGDMEDAVRSGPVVVANVLAEHRLELTAREDKELVQAVL